MLHPSDHRAWASCAELRGAGGSQGHPWGALAAGLNLAATLSPFREPPLPHYRLRHLCCHYCSLPVRMCSVSPEAVSWTQTLWAVTRISQNVVVCFRWGHKGILGRGGARRGLSRASGLLGRPSPHRMALCPLRPTDRGSEGGSDLPQGTQTASGRSEIASCHRRPHRVSLSSRSSPGQRVTRAWDGRGACAGPATPPAWHEAEHTGGAHGFPFLPPGPGPHVPTCSPHRHVTPGQCISPFS